jgi:hypothetical protein
MARKQKDYIAGIILLISLVLIWAPIGILGSIKWLANIAILAIALYLILR